MRDIKFRAWDDRVNDMLSPITVMDFNLNALKAERYSLMQYTGLKDKNGVEIYEGDICTQLYIRKFGEQDNPRLQGQVTFDATRGWCVAFEPIWPNDIEVIGNIYQNKDLLK